MFDYVRYFVATAVWFFILGVGLWRGERPERIVAGAMLVGTILTPIVQARAIFDHPDWGIMGVDVAVTLIITWVALWSDRWWPLFCAAYHVLAVGVHLMRGLRPDASQFAYLTAGVMFSYLGLFAVAAGLIALETRRFRRGRISAVAV